MITPNTSASTSSSSISSSSATTEHCDTNRPSRKSIFGAFSHKFKSSSKDKSLSLSSSILTRTSASSPEVIKRLKEVNIPSNKLSFPFRNNILKNLTNSHRQSRFTDILESSSSTEGSRRLVRSLRYFSHFDIQSVFFSYESLALALQQSKDITNIRTGASLALEQINKNSQSRGSSSAVLFTPETNSSRSFILKEKSIKPADEILVEECPCFRVERGGDSFPGLGLMPESLRQIMDLNSTILLNDVSSKYDKQIIALINENQSSPFKLEYQDWGAFFYRFYFYNQEHSNYLSDDPVVGPVAISLRREKLNRTTNKGFNFSEANDKSSDYAYRFIFRSSGVRFIWIYLTIRSTK